MGGRLGMRCKGLEDLNVYRIQQEREAKVREDLNVSRGGWGACEGQALALRAPRRAFFVARGPSRLYQCDAGFAASPTLPTQSLPHLVHPANPGHPASDVIAIKVLTDLFSWLRLRSIDIQVFQTFAPYKKNARSAQPPRTTQHSAAGPIGPECL